MDLVGTMAYHCSDDKDQATSIGPKKYKTDQPHSRFYKQCQDAVEFQPANT